VLPDAASLPRLSRPDAILEHGDDYPSAVIVSGRDDEYGASAVVHDVLAHRFKDKTFDRTAASAADDDHPGAFRGGENGATRQVVLDAHHH
jgi:hypothetical protein